MSHRRLLLALLLLSLAACELIVDFDSPIVDDSVPVPIPQLDGAVTVMPDASAVGDGTVVRPPTDAGRDAGDAGGRADAARDGGLDAALAFDGAASDAGIDGSDIDAANDGGAGPDPVLPDAEAAADASGDALVDPSADGGSAGDGTVPVASEDASAEDATVQATGDGG